MIDAQPMPNKVSQKILMWCTTNFFLLFSKDLFLLFFYKQGKGLVPFFLDVFSFG